jgi:hypothetical protein
VLTACAGVVLVLVGFTPERTTDVAPAVPHGQPRGRARVWPARPPQFVLVSFDGAGGARLWTYWRSVARRAGARFTFFVSGVYLLDEARRSLYRPPRHTRGSSDIGFAQPEGDRPAVEVVRGTLRQIAAGYREGHEIGTHYNGHFCAPYAGSVDEWTRPDWGRELDEFEKLLFRAGANNRLRPPLRLPFGPADVVGGRTPCLEGRLGTLYPALARRGFRYDASQVARLGDWPRRELGMWNVPLLEIPLAGHTFDVVSMDYNLFVNQTGGTSAPPSAAAAVERETSLTLRRAFRSTYFGNRAPFSFGSHFATWNHGAYNRALARFLVETCRMPEVRCVSIRELVDWLEAVPPKRLRAYRRLYRG